MTIKSTNSQIDRKILFFAIGSSVLWLIILLVFLFMLNREVRNPIHKLDIFRLERVGLVRQIHIKMLPGFPKKRVIEVLKELKTYSLETRYAQKIIFYLYTSENPPRMQYEIHYKSSQWEVVRSINMERK